MTAIRGHAQLLLSNFVSYKAKIIADGASAYWTFDNTLASEVGSFTWTLNAGTALSYVSPLITQGMAASFTAGDSDYRISFDSIFGVLTFTLECWIEFTTGSNQVVFENNGNNGFSLQINGGKVQLNIGGISTVPITASTINDGLRHQVVFVINSTSQKVYVDGALDNSHTFSLTNTTSGDINLGSRAGSFGYVGILDELDWYSGTQLSAGQVLNHFTLGTT